MWAVGITTDSATAIEARRREKGGFAIRDYQHLKRCPRKRSFMCLDLRGNYEERGHPHQKVIQPNEFRFTAVNQYHKQIVTQSPIPRNPPEQHL